MSEKKVMTKLAKQLSSEKPLKMMTDKHKEAKEALDEEFPEITEEMIIAGMSAFGDRDHLADPTLLSKKIARTYRAMARLDGKASRA